MKKFDKETKVKSIYKAKDACGDEILVGDIVIGAIGTNSAYIFKGEVLEIMAELIKVKPLWGYWSKEFRVAPKRVRALKYEKI